MHAVVADSSGRAHLLAHGSTIHGAEWVLDEAGQPLDLPPGAGQLFPSRWCLCASDRQRARCHEAASSERVAVVGLGMGSLACHARDGERWDFFEIDPEVVRLARDTQVFPVTLSVRTAGKGRARRRPADTRGY